MRESDGPSDIDVTPVVEIAPDGPKAILLKGNGCSRTEINEYVLQVSFKCKKSFKLVRF